MIVQHAEPLLRRQVNRDSSGKGGAGRRRVTVAQRAATVDDVDPFR